MASFFMGSHSKVALFLTLLLCGLNMLNTVMCVEYEVGEDKGWAIPPSKDSQLYNEWASKNRFLVNDTLHFHYKKDSVLVVTDDEYEKCKSSHPIFFANNGDTEFRLDRPGLFYFISGVAGHCERGVKMIVKVLQPPNNATAPPPKKNGAALTGGTVYSPTRVVLIMVMSFFGAFLA